MTKKLNVVVVGLGFGGAFVPIYRHHPNVASVGLYDPNTYLMDFYTKRYGCDKIYNSFEDVVEDKSVDAVHLVSPIPLHEEQILKVLQSGKHCASTVPMALSLDGLHKIVKLVNKTGKNYMMMETAVYTRHFLHVREMIKNGEFGRIQFLRGAHYQDMEHWPDYWMGLPPMYYGTHAIAPLVIAAESRIVKTHCFGSGVMREELTKQYNNPFPIECAIFEFENGLKGEVTRSLFSTARTITESFNIYGEKRTFEWQQIEEENPVLFTLGDSVPGPWGGFYRGKPCACERIEPKNRDDLLPKEIAKYTVRAKYRDVSNPEVAFEEGGGHGGSHPHLVHEFISSILEERKPLINEIIAANITAAGICAHESAMNGGKEVIIPDFGDLVN
jgi:predicted dehydrogenase